MDKEAKAETIRHKCDTWGCEDKARKRHHQLFVFEHWDVHPSADFTDWLKSWSTEKPVTMWNADAIRQEFYQWQSQNSL